MKQDVPKRSLLSAFDPSPVEWVNADSTSPIMLVCEHAGRTIPAKLGDLGLPSGALDTHIGWDIGAEALARELADRLSAPLILQHYSRLLIDCNRPPNTNGSIPKISDGIAIPANASISPGETLSRRKEIFDPLDDAISACIKEHPRQAAFSIHSFTGIFEGRTRPWHAGILSRRDTNTANTIINHLRTNAPGLLIALNEPYRIDDATDWFIPAHAEKNGLAHALIEIRNDQLNDSIGVARWADLLATPIAAITGSSS